MVMHLQGHTAAQEPQRVHLAGSIWAKPFSTRQQTVVHSLKQLFLGLTVVGVEPLQQQLEMSVAFLPGIK